MSAGRVTCPRTCAQWASCMGNHMPRAWRIAYDDWLLPALEEEIWNLAAMHDIFAVRLHSLGDFADPPMRGSGSNRSGKRQRFDASGSLRIPRRRYRSAYRSGWLGSFPDSGSPINRSSVIACDDRPFSG